VGFVVFWCFFGLNTAWCWYNIEFWGFRDLRGFGYFKAFWYFVEVLGISACLGLAWYRILRALGLCNSFWWFCLVFVVKLWIFAFSC